MSGKHFPEDKPIWVQDYEKRPICEIVRNSDSWRQVAQKHNIHAMAALPLHKNGQIIGVMNLNASEPYAFDIAAQKLLNELVISIDFALDNFERKEQLQLSAQVFTQSNEGLILLDNNCNIVMVNKAFTKITGYSEEEALGKNPALSGVRKTRWGILQVHVGCHFKKLFMAGRIVEQTQGWHALSTMAFDPVHAGCLWKTHALHRSVRRYDRTQENGRAGSVACPFRCLDRLAESYLAARQEQSGLKPCATSQ